MKLFSRFASAVTLRMAAMALMSGAALLNLTGCGWGVADSAPAAAMAAGALGGNVHGGVSPVNASHVHVMAAGQNGYYNNGGTGLGASTSLLTANLAGTDSIGGYVLTSANGGFNIPAGSYTCTSTQQVYLLATQGDSGAGNNANLSMMSVLGDCPAAGNFAASVPFVWVNEVSTVAAAFSFAGFAVDMTHVGSANTTLAKTQMKNAFANSGNLLNVATGAALATTGNVTAPQTTVNTLANILVACVNSTGASSSACTTLFANAQGTSGAAPTDTATAMINIAHAPFTNVANLYGLQTGFVAFTPALTSQPVDFAVGVKYTLPSAAGNALAIDSGGNVWIGSNDQPTLTKVSPLGAIITNKTVWTGGGGSFCIAIDSSNAVWAVNHDTAYTTKLNSDGSTAVAPFTNADSITLYSCAVDASNNLWFESTSASQKLYEYSPSGTLVGGPFVIPISNMQGLAFDSTGQLWIGSSSNGNGMVANTSGGTVATFTNPSASQQLAMDSTNRAIFASNASSSIATDSLLGGTLNQGTFTGGPGMALMTAVDGANLTWYTVNGGGFSAYTSGGALVGPTAGLKPGTVYTSVAADGAGNIWLGGSDTTTLTEFIGLGNPTATPVLGSNHGSRP